MEEQTGTYITILNDTLEKKEKVIRSLLEQTHEQTKLLEAETLDYDLFNETIRIKDELLAQLKVLDEGFLDLYAKVGRLLKEQPAEFPEQIGRAQALVRTQTDLTAELTAAEERNKSRLALHLSSGRQKVKDFKVSSRTAAAYYKNMSGKHQDGDSYFFNRKK